MWHILALLLGASIGSFLNVVVYRLPKKGLKLWDPFYSFCIHCGHRLSWKDNIPIISYVLLKGRCRYCGAKIPVRYLLVEVLNTALYLVESYLTYDVSTLVSLWGITSTLIAISFMDLETWHVHDSLIVSLAIFSFVFFLRNTYWMDGLVSEAVGFGLFYFLYKVKKGMGSGDVMVVAASAFTMDPMTFSLAVLISAATGLSASLVLFKGLKPKKALPFTPFLSVGIMFGILKTVWR